MHGEDTGSAVTVGSGVPLNTLYTASKSVGKIIVGGTAANVVAAGGYVQGAGHSAFSPIFGLAADNVLGRYESFFVVEDVDANGSQRISGCSREWGPRHCE